MRPSYHHSRKFHALLVSTFSSSLFNFFNARSSHIKMNTPHNFLLWKAMPRFYYMIKGMTDEIQWRKEPQYSESIKIALIHFRSGQPFPFTLSVNRH